MKLHNATAQEKWRVFTEVYKLSEILGLSHHFNCAGTEVK